MFGFSRGAFSARCLVGMVTYCGIIDPSRIHYSPAPPGGNSADAIATRQLQEHFGVRDLHSAIALAINTATNACRVGIDPIFPGPHGWPVYHWQRDILRAMGCVTPGPRLSQPSMAPPDFRLAFSHRLVRGDLSVAHHHIHIKMVGVFDTVPALQHDGEPFPTVERRQWVQCCARLGLLQTSNGSTRLSVPTSMPATTR